MEWSEVVSRRRMVRDFTDQPVRREVLLPILDAARRVPTAGFSQGIDFLVLEGKRTEQFWSHTLPLEDRPGFRWPGLLRAPIILLPMADPSRYLDRYSEPDKQQSGLGDSEEAWPVPYWFIDCGMAAMALLYGVVNAGLGALFFGIFRNERALLESLGVAEGQRPIGAIAIGYPTPEARASKREGTPSRKARRPIEEVVHWGQWNTSANDTNY
jgi:nitroreductase